MTAQEKGMDELVKRLRTEVCLCGVMGTSHLLQEAATALVTLGERLEAMQAQLQHAQDQWTFTAEELRRTREVADRAETQLAQVTRERDGMREALTFYADDSRYNGGNQRPVVNDPFTPEGNPYRQDVTRDRGAIARAALKESP
jgi:hypothetical protein